jgi:hypothetical protein
VWGRGERAEKSRAMAGGYWEKLSYVVDDESASRRRWVPKDRPQDLGQTKK